MSYSNIQDPKYHRYLLARIQSWCCHVSGSYSFNLLDAFKSWFIQQFIKVSWKTMIHPSVTKPIVPYYDSSSLKVFIVTAPGCGTDRCCSQSQPLAVEQTDVVHSQSPWLWNRQMLCTVTAPGCGTDMLFTVTAPGCGTDRCCSVTAPGCGTDRCCSQSQPHGCGTDRCCSQSQPLAVEQTDVVHSHSPWLWNRQMLFTVTAPGCGTDRCCS